MNRPFSSRTTLRGASVVKSCDGDGGAEQSVLLSSIGVLGLRRPERKRWTSDLERLGFSPGERPLLLLKLSGRAGMGGGAWPTGFPALRVAWRKRGQPFEGERFGTKERTSMSQMDCARSARSALLTPAGTMLSLDDAKLPVSPVYLLVPKSSHASLSLHANPRQSWLARTRYQSQLTERRRSQSAAVPCPSSPSGTPL